MKTRQKKRLIIGMSGASGAILGIEMLQALQDHDDWETHLVMSEGAELTICQETEYTVQQVARLAAQVHPVQCIGASIASGTYKTEGMVVVPCSMKTMAGIACGYSDNLLLRAADVVIKERRTLVVVPRESPLSTIHIRNMLTVAEAGAIVVPPVITCYNAPKSIADMNRHIVARVLDKFGIETAGFKRWGEDCGQE